MKEYDDEPIDFVIPWVNGNDIEWQKERAKYSNKKEEEFNPVRYRDWENLKYWFRAVEKYAPWVNKVYFITCGHLPEWLNIDNPKLVVVNHKDYIPEKYLPTFSSHPIELNMHRIKGLSERFVYFNDDMFLVGKAKKEDFFKNGKPCDTALLNVHCPNDSESIYDIQINNVRIINSHFDMKKYMRENKTKWFNLKYGLMTNMQNLVFSRCNRYPGFQPLHVCDAFLKSTFEEVWEKEYEKLDTTCSHKFRDWHDVNQWLMKDWQIASDNFYPSNKSKTSKVVYLSIMSLDKRIKAVKKALFGNKTIHLCINDGDMDDFDTTKEAINALFDKKFPDKSSFEK